MLNTKSPLPLYHQLAELLLRDIRAGVYAEGEKIPSENALVAQHGIGRPTVRQALGSLVRRGVLVRKRGSGTFVAQQPETVSLFSLAGTLKSLKNTGCELDVEMVQRPVTRRIGQDAGDDEANPFGGKSAIALCRLSRLDGVPVLVEDIFMHPEIFIGIEDMNLDGQSLSGIVEESFGLALTSAEQHFRINYPDDRLAGLLGVPKSMPILTVNRFLHFPQVGNAIYSTLHCRTDQFIFTQQIGGISNV